MKRVPVRVLFLMTALALLLSGCGFADFLERAEQLHGPIRPVAYEDMEYIRPDMDQIQAALEAGCAAAEQGESVNAVLETLFEFYNWYDDFDTNYNLANIRYFADTTDTYWEEEYEFCSENFPAVTAAMEELYRAMARSPLRQELEESYFGEEGLAAYEGESMWDETYLALMEQEAQLQNRYYELMDQSQTAEEDPEAFYAGAGRQLAELYVEMVALRQEIATCAGYDSYADYAYDVYYYRDYTPWQAEAYLKQLGAELAEVFEPVSQRTVWDLASGHCSEEDTFRYVEQAARAMGGDVEEAFELLEEARLYDLTYGENKFDTCYEVFLWSYHEPFIFMCPLLDQTDKLSFAHEFGHFANDYVCGGSYAGIDIAEIHSQAFEYLSLCYGEDTHTLAEYKMADSLAIYVYNAACALFEHQVYALTADQLTADRVIELCQSVGGQFGLGEEWDGREFVLVPHFFEDPLYMISYVVSNDVAMQFYQMEQEEMGAGLELYQECLVSEESYILEFVRTYELENPFSKERIQQVGQLFREVFPPETAFGTAASVV